MAFVGAPKPAVGESVTFRNIWDHLLFMLSFFRVTSFALILCYLLGLSTFLLGNEHFVRMYFTILALFVEVYAELEAMIHLHHPNVVKFYDARLMR